MTERNEPGTGAPPAPAPEAEKERDSFSYEGSRIPWSVILIWLAFFVWGLVYLLRWVPESWQEWFSR
jgi:hypothetical protein